MVVFYNDLNKVARGESRVDVCLMRVVRIAL